MGGAHATSLCGGTNGADCGNGALGDGFPWSGSRTTPSLGCPTLSTYLSIRACGVGSGADLPHLTDALLSGIATRVLLLMDPGGSRATVQGTRLNPTRLGLGAGTLSGSAAHQRLRGASTTAIGAATAANAAAEADMELSTGTRGCHAA